MNSIKRHGFALIVATAAAVASPAAMAASTWNFQQPGQCSQNATNANNYGNSWNCNPGSGAPVATATGWSNNGSGGKFAIANLDDNGASGYGVKNSTGSEGLNATSPNHAMDNSGNLDAMLLSFTSSVILKQLTLGWWQTDSDITVMRYTGASAPDLTAMTSGNLLTSGWTLVGNYFDIGTNTVNINAAGGNSSWWLISAFNSSAGSGDTAADYVKVMSVAGDKYVPPSGKVPEPASLALVALALAGAAGSRRFAKKS